MIVINSARWSGKRFVPVTKYMYRNRSVYYYATKTTEYMRKTEFGTWIKISGIEELKEYLVEE